MTATSEWILDEGNNKSNSSDGEWVLDDQKRSNNGSKESLLTSIAAAPYRVGGDIGQSAYDFAKKTPEYYEKAKTEIPGLMSLGLKHPFHGFGQALAGTHELVNSIAQLPKNLSSYGENRLNLLPQGTTNLIDKITPEDTTESINQLFGKPTYPGESALRGGIKNIPQIVGGINVAKFLNPAKYKSANIAKNISKAQDSNFEKYGKYYNDIFSHAEKNNLGKTLPGLIKKLDLRTALKNEPADALVSKNEFTSNPTSRTAHEFKSDLLRIQRKLNKMQGKEVLSKGNKNKLDAVNKTISDIEHNMFTNSTGKIHKEIADKYRKTQEGYEKEVLPYTLNTDIQQYRKGKLLPKELTASLKKGEFAAMRGKQHPELFRRDQLKNTLLGLAIAGSGTYGAKSIFDLVYGK